LLHLDGDVSKDPHLLMVGEEMTRHDKKRIRTKEYGMIPECGIMGRHGMLNGPTYHTLDSFLCA